MGAPIHPDRAGLLVCADVVFDRDYTLGVGIFFLPHPQGHRSTINVRHQMNAALLLGKRDARWIPAIGPQTGSVVDRNTEIIAELRSGPALELVLMLAGHPLTGEIHLRCERD